MSDPIAKAERSKVKDIRQGGIQQREYLRPVSKKDKPIIVEFRWKQEKHRLYFPESMKTWRKFGNYRTLEIANKVMAEQERKHGLYEMRIKE